MSAVAAFVAVGAALNALHPVFANRGYQHGRVVLISTYTALMSMASPRAATAWAPLSPTKGSGRSSSPLQT